MKKLFCALFAMVALLVFGAAAGAADFSASGSYYAVGYYDNNHTLQKGAGASSAFYAQRLRVAPVFQVVEGLTLNARFDALEKVWGNDGWVGGDQENISWDRAFVTFMTKIGKFDVGYQAGGNVWGTTFGDTTLDRGRVKFTTKVKDVILVLVTEKEAEGDIGTAEADADYDNYMIATVYRTDWGNAGLLWKYVNDDTLSGSFPFFKQKGHIFSPYVKANLGPTYLEAQIYYAFGEIKMEEESAALGAKDIDISNWSWYLMGKYDFGPAYVGAMYAYTSGDDPDTADEVEGGLLVGGEDWDPCLILWNDNLNKWMGDLGYVAGSQTDDSMTNASLYQLFCGAAPMEKLSLTASFTYARANEKQGRLDADYGQEIDITASYKLYDNLDYMVGFGYLMTGDWYKGAGTTNEIDDDYLLLNKLTLNF